MRFNFRSLSLALVALGGTALASASGCALVTNTTAVQCTSEAECLSLGPDFAGTTCDKVTRTCVKVSAETDLCSTNQQCIDKVGGPAICRKSDRKCIGLITPECNDVLQQPGELLNDDAVVIGSLTPNGHSELGTVMERSVRMAQKEFSLQARGIPPLPGKTSRPVVIVTCREFGAGIEGLARAAEHLAKTVQVPVVIGPVDPANAGRVLAPVMYPNKVLSILPTATTSALTTLPNPIAPTPLLWRLNADDRMVAAVSAEFVSKVMEPRLAAAGIAGPYRVAILAEGSLVGQSSGARMQEVLKFNGKPAVPDNFNDGNYAYVNFGVLDDPVGNPNPEAKIASALNQIYAFKPHIILHSYVVSGIQKVFIPLENGWGASAGGAPYPLHIGLTAPWGSFTPLLSFLEAPPAPPLGPRRSRVFIAQAPRNLDPAVADFVSRFRNDNPDFAMSGTPNTPLVHAVYDASYQAIYALAAVGTDKPLTGENMAGTLGRFVPPGMSIQIGPDDILKGNGILSSGAAFDIKGLYGAMDFDVKTGAPVFAMTIQCPVVDMMTSRITGWRPSGFSFDPATNMGIGMVMGCP